MVSAQCVFIHWFHSDLDVCVQPMTTRNYPRAEWTWKALGQQGLYHLQFYGDFERRKRKREINCKLVLAVVSKPI